MSVQRQHIQAGKGGSRHELFFFWGGDTLVIFLQISICFRYCLVLLDDFLYRWGEKRHIQKTFDTKQRAKAGAAPPILDSGGHGHEKMKSIIPCRYRNQIKYGGGKIILSLFDPCLS